MRVFNPDRTPVTVDDGVVVEAGEWADVEPSDRVSRLIEADPPRLLTEDIVNQPDPEPATAPEPVAEPEPAPTPPVVEPEPVESPARERAVPAVPAEPAEPAHERSSTSREKGARR